MGMFSRTYEKLTIGRDVRALPSSETEILLHLQDTRAGIGFV
jgi:hypothetical protein